MRWRSVVGRGSLAAWTSFCTRTTFRWPAWPSTVSGISETAEPWTLRNTNLTLHRFLKTRGDDEMTVDLVLANSPEHRKMVAKSVSAPAEAGPVSVASKSDLIALKRARNSDQDRVDIKGLEDDTDREGCA